MDIIKAHATKNLCYITNQKMIPKGIVVHSTGANNPNLKRYVDCPEIVGVNKYGNHWNQATPSGRKVCVHAFIGYDKNHEVRVVEILPLNICCWGVGAIPYDKNGNELTSSSSPKFSYFGPSYNYDPAYIQFEICEDDLTDEKYYREAFSVAEAYCAELCNTYNIPVDKIVGHIEAHEQGYGSNHGDPEHWMKRFGENMNDFRNRVKSLLNNADAKTEVPNTSDKADKKNDTTTPLIKKGDLVSIASNAVYYSGKAMPSWVKSQLWYVKTDPKGDRVVIDKNESGTNSICSPVNAKYLTVVNANQETTKAKNSPYLVQITASSLNIRKGPGTNFGKNGCITDKGIYTIVEESEGQGAKLWGKLKSGTGWISLDYTKNIKK